MDLPAFLFVLSPCATFGISDKHPSGNDGRVYQAPPHDPTVIAPPVSLPSIQAIGDSWNYTAGVAPGAWVTLKGNAMSNGTPR